MYEMEMERDSTRLSPLKRAYLAIDELQSKLEIYQRHVSEPIAVIGMGCRFPGDGSNHEKFWQLLHNGVDATRDFPDDRFDVDECHDPGIDYPRRGSFVDEIDQFDPQFFGIAPREALRIDPQQRFAFGSKLGSYRKRRTRH